MEITTNQHQKKLLNIGCGNRIHPDWINIDVVKTAPNVIPYNLKDGIPFGDKSLDVVYHSHVLEHFSKEEGKKLLKECVRVLKKGGTLRIAVPDLERIALEYIKNLKTVMENGNNKNEANYNWILLELYDQTVREKSGGDMAKYLKQPFIPNENYVYSRVGSEAKDFREHVLLEKEKLALNNKTRLKNIFTISKYKNKLLKLLMGKEFPYYEIGKFRASGEIHKWMYDRYSLSKALSDEGLSDTKVMDAFTSKISNWNEFELDSKNGQAFKPDSLFIEASKL